jgi:SAM-dependent methyltransferase
MSQKQWTDFYTKNPTQSFPIEGVIRLLKGSPPNQKMPRPSDGQYIVDIGCGDGGNFPLYHQLGLKASGTEITDEICSKTWTNLQNLEVPVTGILKGICSDLPFQNDVFDYAVSWNSCYYMNIGTGRFEDHVSEMARILKPNGWLICSIPNRDCFIWDDSHVDPLDHRYRIIDNEYFGLRSGERMRCFSAVDELQNEFSTHFANFSHATIDTDWFGIRYSWHVFTAQKR